MPAGLSLSTLGEVSGTATAPAGRYRVRVTVTDSSSPEVTCTTTGAFDVFVTETRVPPTVTVSECAATFNLTDVRTLNVTTSGFSGSLTCTVQGPSWLSCAPAARGSAHTHVLTAATDRQVGNYPYTVTVTDSAGARASASCSIRVSRDVIQPLSMEDKVLDAKVGSQWVGNLIVRGGDPTATTTFEWTEEPSRATGLVLNTSTGDFSGTAVGPPGTVFYTAKVKRGELEATAQVTGERPARGHAPAPRDRVPGRHDHRGPWREHPPGQPGLRERQLPPDFPRCLAPEPAHDLGGQLGGRRGRDRRERQDQLPSHGAFGYRAGYLHVHQPDRGQPGRGQGLVRGRDGSRQPPRSTSRPGN